MREARRRRVLGLVLLKQGLRQGYVRVPLLFNIFLLAVIRVAFTRFEADKDIVGALMSLRKKTGACYKSSNCLSWSERLWS